MRQFVACSNQPARPRIRSIKNGSKKISMTKALFTPLILTTITLSGLSFSKTAIADNSARPDSHAPISVMGDHTHDAGEWMLSYRFMTMSMAHNYLDSNKVSTQEVLQDFMVAPESMDMEMHMLGAMYAPTDDITLMAMANYLSTSMDHVTRMDMSFTTKTAGIADVKLGALININKTHNSSSHFNLGVSVPTGSVKEKDQTPAGYNRLPYPMQLGSGTYDIEIGATHTQFFEKASWGVQAKQLFRTGDTEFDYRLGNRFNLKSWYAYNLHDHLSLNMTVAYTNQKNIKGQDTGLNPMMVSTARPDLRGGYFWDAGIGANIKLNAQHRIAVDVLNTVYQNLDGPQLGRDWSATLGWQYSF